MLIVRRLVWDAWNLTHIARHSVMPEEVEQVCHNNFIARSSYKGRLLIIGPTSKGRMLAVVFSRMSAGRYYVITARPADRKERALYRKERGGTI